MKIFVTKLNNHRASCKQKNSIKKLMKNTKPPTFQTESFICQNKKKIISMEFLRNNANFVVVTQEHSKKSVGNMQIQNINETGNIVKLG